MITSLILTLLVLSRNRATLAAEDRIDSASLPDRKSGGDSGDLAPASSADINADDPLFCFIVRTYWGHGDEQGGSLRRLIASLQRQKHQRWEAVLMVADSKPFRNIHHIVDDIGDGRVWVFAEWIGSYFSPKDKGEWRDGYHGLLFNLTDDAIQVCPPKTQWLIVTNGDNEYADGFLERTLQEIKQAEPRTPPDIIAFDFYSRFLRPTAPSCTRFSIPVNHPAASSSSGAPPLCKRNRLRWCHTDLGANVLHWPRFMRERRKFGFIDVAAIHTAYMDLDEAHHDGILMEHLIRGGWRVIYVHDACLFNHAPSPQLCALSGGVWDDRDIITTGGGKCLSQKEADRVLAENGTQVETVNIQLVHDSTNLPTFSSYEYYNQQQVQGNGVQDGKEGLNPNTLTLKCMRLKSFASEGVLGQTMVWFSDLCADDDLDLPSFNATLATFYPDWEELLIDNANNSDDVNERGNGAAESDANYDPYLYGDEL